MTEIIKPDPKDNPPKNVIGFVYWLGKKIFVQKKWWLFPFWVLLLVIALVLWLSGHGSILPVIYIAF